MHSRKTTEKAAKNVFISVKDDLRGTRHYTHSCVLFHYSRQRWAPNFDTKIIWCFQQWRNYFRGRPQNRRWKCCAKCFEFINVCNFGCSRRNTKKECQSVGSCVTLIVWARQWRTPSDMIDTLWVHRERGDRLPCSAFGTENFSLIYAWLIMQFITRRRINERMHKFMNTRFLNAHLNSL